MNKFASLAVSSAVSLLFASQSLFASEVQKYNVTGMHCGGCVAMVKQKVCSLPGIENCNVSLVKGKKQLGQLSYSVKDGSTVDVASLEKAVKEAGDDYELVVPKSSTATAQPKAEMTTDKKSDAKTEKH